MPTRQPCLMYRSLAQLERAYEGEISAQVASAEALEKMMRWILRVPRCTAGVFWQQFFVFVDVVSRSLLVHDEVLLLACIWVEAGV